MSKKKKREFDLRSAYGRQKKADIVAEKKREAAKEISSIEKRIGELESESMSMMREFNEYAPEGLLVEGGLHYYLSILKKEDKDKFILSLDKAYRLRNKLKDLKEGK